MNDGTFITGRRILFNFELVEHVLMDRAKRETEDDREQGPLLGKI